MYQNLFSRLLPWLINLTKLVGVIILFSLVYLTVKVLLQVFLAVLILALPLILLYLTLRYSRRLDHNIELLWLLLASTDLILLLLFIVQFPLPDDLGRLVERWLLPISGVITWGFLLINYQRKLNWRWVAIPAILHGIMALGDGLLRAINFGISDILGQQVSLVALLYTGFGLVLYGLVQGRLQNGSELPPKSGWTDHEITRKEDDRFGFRDYAQVLAGRVRQADTPLTIGVFGRWGSGKSSLMHLIEAEIADTPAACYGPLNNLGQMWQSNWDTFFNMVRYPWQSIKRIKFSAPNYQEEKQKIESFLTNLRHLVEADVQSGGDRIETLWINVWQLSNQEQLWNAFVQALLTQAHAQLRWHRRVKFDWTLFWERINWRTLGRMLVVNSYRIVIAVTPILLATFWPDRSVTNNNQLLAFALNPVTGQGASLILTMWLLVRPAVEAAKGKVSLDLKTVLKDAPYQAQVSALQQLEKQFERFKTDFTRQLAVERAFQAAVESCTDIAAHIVSVYQLGHPQESRDVYQFLLEAGYLEQPLGEAMMALVDFRNRLVHLYWDVDVERLYQYLQEDVTLLRQFRDFTLQILIAEG